jgi:hypothetical protein
MSFISLQCVQSIAVREEITKLDFSPYRAKIRKYKVTLLLFAQLDVGELPLVAVQVYPQDALQPGKYT